MDGKYKIDLQRGLISEWMLPFEMVRNEKKLLSCMTHLNAFIS